MTENNATKQRVWATFDFEVTNFNRSKAQKNGLMGYVTVRVSQLNTLFKNIGVFTKDGKISITPPSMSPCQETNYTFVPIMSFYDDRDLKIFQNKVIEALKIYSQEEGEEIDLGSGVLMV